MHDHLLHLERHIGYSFHNRELLLLALTHRSVSDQNNNQRLEFLGDAVIALVLSEHLYQHYPQDDEGALTYKRSILVRGSALVAHARKLQLHRWLRLSEGEISSGGKERASTLEDAVEALIGAIYLDGGLSAAHKVLHRLFGDIETLIQSAQADHNPKGRLQEIIQKRPLPTHLTYRTVEIVGKPPAEQFHVELSIDGTVVARGCGSSKKSAEEAAARAALQKVFPEE